jgi:choline dehydrogenase-like flavoprotein
MLAMDAKHGHDVIVVGSGAGGGIAAYVLTHKGLNVLLLESGRNYDPDRETPMFQVNADAPLNGAATPDKPFGFYSASIGEWENPDEPYSVIPGTEFQWWRARMLGGRTNHWGRITLRYGPYDFNPYSRTGLGVNWPITYDDLEPYYDKVERLIGVFGATEGIENSPDSAPGVLLPPPTMRLHELWMQLVLAKKMGIRVVPVHAAILTRPMNGRQACVYATPCGRGCAIRATFQSPTVLLQPALETGRLVIRTGAIAYKVSLNKRGRATGIHYIDRTTGARQFARGRAVVLAASACESARILLNSKSPAFPNGMANSSGQVGRNLTDSMNYAVLGALQVLQRLPPFNDDGVSIPHAYVPWWGHRDQAAGRMRFAGEYHIEIFGGRHMPSVDMFRKLPLNDGKPLYGHALRAQLRNDFGSEIALVAHGGMVPNENSYCELDPALRDRWGVPVLRFNWGWGPQELEQMSHASDTMTEFIAAMGGRVTFKHRTPVGGSGMHEVGTARMGFKPNDSVLNSFGHAWDVRNLYIADGASFSGHACKNPTETIMALAWRASDHLSQSFMRKDL